MRSPSISVVIPLFNKAPHIGRAIESVLRQSVQDFELIVVDDGSTDGGDRIARAMDDPRIEVVSQANGGVSCARNRGIAQAQADLVAFLDADDSYNPGFLSEILRLSQRHPDAGAYGTAFEVLAEDGRSFVNRPLSLRRAKAEEALIRDYFRDILDGPVIWTSATAVPRRTFERVGLFPAGVRLGEDLDLWLRIGARFPIAVSGYVGAVYHREACNRTDTGRIRGVEYELVRTGLRLLDRAELGQGRKARLREYVSRYQITTAYHLILLGERERARDMLLASRPRRAYLRKLWWLLWTFVPTPVALALERAARKALA